MSCIILFPRRAGYKENMIYMVIGLIIATFALWEIATEGRG